MQLRSLSWLREEKMPQLICLTELAALQDKNQHHKRFADHYVRHMIIEVEHSTILF